jgi:hypothetical protein
MGNVMVYFYRINDDLIRQDVIAILVRMFTYLNKTKKKDEGLYSTDIHYNMDNLPKYHQKDKFK